jgi:uncharacterized protein (DUF1499 family)
MADPAPTRSSLADRLGTIALVVALTCAAAALLAGPGYRLGWWPLGPGIQVMRWAATLALIAAALGLVALALGLGAGTRRPRWLGLAALVVGLGVAAPPIMMWRALQQLPHIHDISTDLERPPAFVAVLPLRQGARNSVEPAPATAALQRQGYPDIGPAILRLPPDQAYARAEAAARAMKWEIVAASQQALRIEATDTTLLFGFKDDVVIRVAPDAGGSRVDVRSLSRIGGFDFGTNAKRVRDYLARLNRG